MFFQNPRTGIRCHCLEVGAGEPVILLHGMGGNHTRWSPAAALLARNFKIYSYDLRGHGLSEKNAALDCGMDAHVEDLAGVMDELGIDRAVIAGHSMGGMIAQQFALTYPEHVTKLVLVATTACLMPNAVKRLIVGLFTKLLRFIPWLPAYFVHRKVRSKPRALFPELDNPDLDFHPVSIARSINAIVILDLRERLPQLRIPTLVISSTIDELIPPALVKSTSELIPGARFVSVENDGHYVPLEQPGPVASEVAAFVNGAAATVEK